MSARTRPHRAAMWFGDRHFGHWGWLATLGAVAAAVLVLLPVYLMVKVSISQPRDVFTQYPSLWLTSPTLRHWRDVWVSGSLWAPLLKSLTTATLTTALALVVATPAAYVISRLPRAARYGVVLGLFLTRMVPEVAIALPISVTFLKLGLLDTTLGLVLAHLTKVLPFIAWVLVGTFETIPLDLEQAAMVDGASKLGALWRVVLPLALPGLAVAAMLTWLESWNEFTFAAYLTLANRTLPLQTFYYIQRGSWFNSAAFATILTIPVLVVTFALQRYLRTGYLSGAIKG